MRRIRIGGLLALILVAGTAVSTQTIQTVSLVGIVADDLGAPLGAVRVTIYGDSGRLGEVSTEVDGTFEYEGLEPGEYRLSASRSGYLGPTPDAPMRVVLTPGIGLRDQVIAITLGRTAAIVGRVIDSNGRPLPSATVVALKVTYDALGNRVLSPPGVADSWEPGRSLTGVEAVSDEEGAYELQGLPPGTYYIGVWPNLTRRLNDELSFVEYYPGVSEPGFATPLELRLGSVVRGVDIALSGTPRYSVALQIEGDVECPRPLAREVFYVAREPLSGFRVTGDSVSIFSGELPEAEGAVVPERASVFQRVGTNSWRIDDLATGRYNIFYSSCDSGMRGRLQVDVVGSDDEPRVMSLNASAVMRATLRVDPELEGEVDQERLGFGILPGEVVPYNWMPATVARTPLFPNATPGRGRRVLAEVALPAGRYRIQPLTGNQAAYVSSMRFNGREIVDGAFDMGIQDGVLEVTFSGPGGTIRGVAQDASGNRIANPQVVLLPAAAGSSLTEPRVIPTDNGGSFEFSRIPPGTYSIVAVENMQENAYLDSEFVRRHAAELVSIRIENGAVNTVQLDVVGVTP